MAVVANKRSVMTLYSGSSDIYSHQTRIVLAEKGVTVDIIDVKPDAKPADLAELNPYNTVPTLVDRDLVLYESRIIMEYLDERFPHPPLMPIYPVTRAKCRLVMHRVEKDWYQHFHVLESETASDSEKEEARKVLRDSLTSIAPVFSDMPFFLNEEFTLVDACIGPLLWRLPRLGIQLPKQAKAVYDYAARLFKRDAFQASLTDQEREMQTETI